MSFELRRCCSTGPFVPKLNTCDGDVDASDAMPSCRISDELDKLNSIDDIGVALPYDGLRMWPSFFPMATCVCIFTIIRRMFVSIFLFSSSITTCSVFHLVEMRMIARETLEMDWSEVIGNFPQANRSIYIKHNRHSTLFANFRTRFRRSFDNSTHFSSRYGSFIMPQQSRYDNFESSRTDRNTSNSIRNTETTILFHVHVDSTRPDRLFCFSFIICYPTAGGALTNNRLFFKQNLIGNRMDWIPRNEWTATAPTTSVQHDNEMNYLLFFCLQWVYQRKQTKKKLRVCLSKHGNLSMTKSLRLALRRMTNP